VSGFYILNVPEFAPMIVAARAIPTCRVERVGSNYVYIAFDGEVEILRAATKLSEAVWFGCLTAGLDCRIVHFDSDRIRLAPAG
jgi:hypothetical protein